MNLPLVQWEGRKYLLYETTELGPEKILHDAYWQLDLVWIQQRLVADGMLEVTERWEKKDLRYWPRDSGGPPVTLPTSEAVKELLEQREEQTYASVDHDAVMADGNCYLFPEASLVSS